MTYEDVHFIGVTASTNYNSKKKIFNASLVEAFIKLITEYKPNFIMIIKATISVEYITSVRGENCKLEYYFQS